MPPYAGIRSQFAIINLLGVFFTAVGADLKIANIGGGTVGLDIVFEELHRPLFSAVADDCVHIQSWPCYQPDFFPWTFQDAGYQVFGQNISLKKQKPAIKLRYWPDLPEGALKSPGSVVLPMAMNYLKMIGTWFWPKNLWQHNRLEWPGSVVLPMAMNCL
jgi:hypothetical protein